MEERVKAGLKAGILCGAVISISLIISFSETLCCFAIVGWIIGLAPGILAVHYGNAAIQNGKDVVVSCVVAGIVFPLSFTCVFILAYAVRNMWPTGEDLLDTGLISLVVSIIFLPVTLGISIVEGLLYAKYSQGISLLGQKAVPSGAQPPPYQTYCPRCANGINKNWVACPRCGYDLRDDTRIYDDKTRIY